MESCCFRSFSSYGSWLRLSLLLQVVLFLMYPVSAELLEDSIGVSWKKDDGELIAMETDAFDAVQAIIISTKDIDDDQLSGSQVQTTIISTRNIDDDQLQGSQVQTTIISTKGMHDDQLPRSQVSSDERRDNQTIEILINEATEQQVKAIAIDFSNQMSTSEWGKYSIWRREYENHRPDYMLKIMRDQIIMAKIYASIAREKKDYNIYSSLMKCIKQNGQSIGEATSDSELRWSALERAKAMGYILFLAKDKYYECEIVAKKLRDVLRSTEKSINLMKKKGTWILQQATKAVSKSLHCLSLQLTNDYFLLGYNDKEEVKDLDKLSNLTLYHIAIFSDNALATSVVVNSTAFHAKEPKKLIFHIVTDRLNFAAMKMWFLVNSPPNVTIQVENLDDFKWLNSSYRSVVHQLESTHLKGFFQEADGETNISCDGSLTYRNPKYLSMLNHLRFYLPEVYPKLDRILFLDDDVVVQKDLTPLWLINMEGMVNGAVETCNGSFGRFDNYLNFANPKISENFDPDACSWAFGMNMFDLKEWRKRNITGIYHHWLDMNEDGTLWKLGSLPPGLIVFNELTYPLHKSWHVLGLGYDPALDLDEIEHGAVIHYNGNYKPWLDLSIGKYKHYWYKFVMPENPYISSCHFDSAMS